MTPPTIAAATSRFQTTSSLLFLPPYSPELNPKENIWDEIRENLQELRPQVHRRRVRQLKQAILYVERNPKRVQSIT